MPHVPSGPTAVSERALGPDLARGVMLLFIALANSHYFLQAESVLGGFPQDTGTLDRVTTWLIATFVDGRSYPLFAFLFGYGVARIVARQVAATPKEIRRVLWRRSAIFIAIGFVDAMLFFIGDILSAYGVLLLVGAWAVGWRDKTVLIVASAFLVLISLPSPDSLSISDLGPDASMLSPDLATQVSERITVYLWVAFGGPLGLACPALVGLWAGRRRVLEQPQEHVRLLVTTAVVAIPIAVLGAQPVALMISGVTDRYSDDTLTYLGPLHDSAGVIGGFGYAALLALIALRLTRSGRVSAPRVRALAALGQRSMSFYLVQSVVWCVVFTPYLLDLSHDLTVTGTALLAITTWLATVVAADRMRAAGKRGPFERLTRRVTYGPPERRAAERVAGPTPS